MFVRVSIVILALSPVVVSVTTFKPNCTASTASVNFVYSSGYRSTLDILWSSLFTIIACTWTVLHLNVPEQRNGRDPGFWGDLKWMCKRMCKSMKWMLITIIAPEVTLALSASRLKSALDSRKKFKHLAALDGIEWTLEHGFLADMGGFGIRVRLPYERGGSSQIERDKIDSNPITGSFMESQDISSGPPISTLDTESKNLQKDSEAYVVFHLTGASLLEARMKGYIKRLPQISKEQINDLSKNDLFTKLITAIQVLSTIMQVIVRRSRNLAISQLELAVTAFSVCAIINYLVTLYQPKGVHTVIVLRNDGQEISFEEAYKIYAERSKSTIFEYPHSESYFCNGGIDSGVANDWGEADMLFSIFLTVSGTIYGAVHCGGWFFTFPTAQELLLWRIAAILTTIFPMAVAGATVVSDALLNLLEDVVDLLFGFFCILYIVARLFIMVEIFRSLFYLPADAFVSTWADNIPHLS